MAVLHSLDICTWGWYDHSMLLRAALGPPVQTTGQIPHAVPNTSRPGTRIPRLGQLQRLDNTAEFLPVGAQPEFELSE